MKLTSYVKNNHTSAGNAPLQVFTFFLLLAFTAGTIPAQRAITNQSTELPAIPDNFNQRWDEAGFTGWLTTHPFVTDNCTNGGVHTCRPMERWSTGFLSVVTASGAGARWVELNADSNSMIYQSVCMTSGESFRYSFLHRGRDSATVDDVAQFRLGIPTGLPAGSKPVDSYSFPIADVRTQNDGGATAGPTAYPNATVAFADAGNGWRRFSGTFNYTGTTQVVKYRLRLDQYGRRQSRQW